VSEKRVDGPGPGARRSTKVKVRVQSRLLLQSSFSTAEKLNLFAAMKPQSTDVLLRRGLYREYSQGLVR
jgi:hypothetical protein